MCTPLRDELSIFGGFLTCRDPETLRYEEKQMVGATETKKTQPLPWASSNSTRKGRNPPESGAPREGGNARRDSAPVTIQGDVPRRKLDAYAVRGTSRPSLGSSYVDDEYEIPVERERSRNHRTQRMILDTKNSITESDQDSTQPNAQQLYERYQQKMLEYEEILRKKNQKLSERKKKKKSPPRPRGDETSLELRKVFENEEFVTFRKVAYASGHSSQALAHSYEERRNRPVLHDGINDDDEEEDDSDEARRVLIISKKNY